MNSVVKRIPPPGTEAYQGGPRIGFVNVSQGGVPKRPVLHATVNERGIDSDRQADKRHHGSPEQALCLYSFEVIEALQGEGHPIEPGSVGENITTRGLDWNEVRPGRRIRIGSVMAELTDWATPCFKNAQFFHEGEFKRMSQDLYPGWSRIYAKVLEGGQILPGDPIQLLD